MELKRNIEIINNSHSIKVDAEICELVRKRESLEIMLEKISLGDEISKNALTTAISYIGNTIELMLATKDLSFENNLQKEDL